MGIWSHHQSRPTMMSKRNPKNKNALLAHQTCICMLDVFLWVAWSSTYLLDTLKRREKKTGVLTTRLFIFFSSVALGQTRTHISQRKRQRTVPSVYISTNAIFYLRSSEIFSFSSLRLHSSSRFAVSLSRFLLCRAIVPSNSSPSTGGLS